MFEKARSIYVDNFCTSVGASTRWRRRGWLGDLNWKAQGYIKQGVHLKGTSVHSCDQKFMKKITEAYAMYTLVHALPGNGGDKTKSWNRTLEISHNQNKCHKQPRT